MPKAKKVAPYRTTKRFGIQNHIGGVWTPQTFETAEAAQKYLDECRSWWPKRDGDGLGRHKVIPVRVTVSALAVRGGD